jgi:hypothetical protein
MATKSISELRTARIALASGMHVLRPSGREGEVIVQMPCCSHEQPVYAQSLRAQRQVKCKACGTRTGPPQFHTLPPPISAQELLYSERTDPHIPAHASTRLSAASRGLQVLSHVPQSRKHVVLRRITCGCEFIHGTSEADLSSASNKCPQCGDTSPDRDAWAARASTPVKLGRPKGANVSITLKLRVAELEKQVAAILQGMDTIIAVNNLRVTGDTE